MDERVVPVQEDSMLKKDHKVVQGTTGENLKVIFIRRNQSNDLDIKFY